MRIAILGDFHLNSTSSAWTELAMEDIARVKPDLVVPLGDFGSRETIGSPEGLEEAARFLNRLSVPLRPIMGNHDLERESGAGPQTQGTMQRHFTRLFGLERPYGVLEYDFVRLFFASTDPQPPHSCYSVQECYVSDEQFDWLCGKLGERPGVPVIFCTHAPPMGCGLRTVPRTHVRATNAYLDQNHDPHRWLRLIRDTPEIVMWFSAHYHLSHIHPDSQTFRGGARFFMTGVHGDRTRDAHRQSRLVDVDSDGIQVRTIDHIERRVTWVGGWSCRGDRSLWANRQTISLSHAYSCPVGTEPAVAHGVVSLDHGRYLVATENGYSWETEAAGEAVWGTCHIGPALTGMALSRQRIWMAWGNEVGWADRHSPWRFVRNAGDAWPERKMELGQPVKRIASREAGGIWAFTGDEIHIVDWDDAGSGKWTASCAAMLHADEAQLSGRADGVVILTDTHELMRYTESTRSMKRLRSHVLAWDDWNGQEAAIVRKDDRLAVIESDNGKTSCAFPFPEHLLPDSCALLPFLYLGDHRAVCIMKDTVYYVSVYENTMQRLDVTIGRAVALAKEGGTGDRDAMSCQEFAVAMRPAASGEHPLLQIWRLTPAGGAGS